jgi:HAD superfamily hydrolase (TIGR01509 family)
MNTYLFDFDGTLVDSMPVYVSSMLRILDENNIPYEKDIVKIITPLGLIGAAEYYITLGLNKPKDVLVSTMKAYMQEEYSYRIPAKSNVIAVLQELKAQGANLNVLTASPHATLDVCLKRLGIYDLFNNVWSCDDFNTTKSDPEIYKMAARRIGESVENILFLDDNYNADKTAKLAGMQVCGVYDESSREYTEEIKSVSDYYIRDFSELLHLNFSEN